MSGRGIARFAKIDLNERLQPFTKKDLNLAHTYSGKDDQSQSDRCRLQSNGKTRIRGNVALDLRSK
jgi:hypothetical protein